jgi:dTDP-4-dehydrorhamnose reductase
MRVVVTGASGQLGGYLVPRLRIGGHAVIAWSGSRTGACAGVPLEAVDLTDPTAVESRLEDARPDALIHAAAISAAESVRADPEGARRVNVEATARLSRWCARNSVRVLFTSTDLVFDGRKPWNREDDPAGPVLAYGRTKRDAEAIVAENRSALIARLSLMFGASRCGRPGFFDQAIDALQRGEPRTFFVDEYRTPIDLATAADALTRLIETDAAGIVHVAGAERMSRHELMGRAASALGLDPAMVRGNRQSDVKLAEPRPCDVSLDTSRLMALLPGLRRPTVEEALGSKTPGFFDTPGRVPG